MTHDELVNLIRHGVAVKGGTWADFGAGSGQFTRALRELIGPQATLYAIDRDSWTLRAQPDDVHTINADFTDPLNLPVLDGLLVANALHFVPHQDEAITALAAYLKPGGRFLLVEYEQRLPWTPFALPYARFATLAQSTGLTHVERIASRTSPTTGATMYAASAVSS